MVASAAGAGRRYVSEIRHHRVVTEERQEWTDDEMMEMLARIHQAAERGRQVAGQRPDAETLSTVLDSYVDLLEATLQVRHHERLSEILDATRDNPMSDWEMSRWHPADGSSPAAHEMEWAAGLSVDWPEDPVRDGIDLIQSLVAAALDHLRGTAVLIRTTHLARAPIAAARCALEACATAAFLLDPDIDPLERLRRVANLRLHQLEEERRESDDEPTENELAEQINNLLSNCQALGLRARRYRPDKNFPNLPNAKGRQDVAQAMIEALFAGLGQSMWRSMSAVAHSRDASTLLMFDVFGGYEDDHVRNHEVASNSIGAIFALVEVAPRLAAYLGWSLDEAKENDPLLLGVWGAGAGLRDDAIREFLFGETSTG
jgi:hypothetical protein